LQAGPFRLVRDRRARVAPVGERHAHRRERGFVGGVQFLGVERGQALRERRVALLLDRIPGGPVAVLVLRPEARVDRADGAAGVRKSRKMASEAASGLGSAAWAAPASRSKASARVLMPP
jgi:hypothetical protein